MIDQAGEAITLARVQVGWSVDCRPRSRSSLRGRAVTGYFASQSVRVSTMG
jgi:hypothetical protein